MASTGVHRIVLGTMEIGRRMNLLESEKFMKLFLSCGYKEIDSAYLYGGGFDGGPHGGLTEEYLGTIGLDSCATISTKANPGGKKTLSAKSLSHQLETSLGKIKRDAVDIFYLHWPCLDVPIVKTLECINSFHKQGKIKEFGLSNFASWQVSEVQKICEYERFLKPTVYQGMYNALTRRVETELISCLRRYRMSFMAYNPLAGGMLTGKHKVSHDPSLQPDMSGRFFGTDPLVVKYRTRYWRDEYFNGIELIESVCRRYNIEMYEVALRWLQYHSLLDPSFNDGIVVGSSNCNNLKLNLDALSDKGPLPVEVVDAIERAYEMAKGHEPLYFRNVDKPFD